jgi:hypothetical protein
VSKDEADSGASWFETREDALLTMRNCYFGSFAFSAWSDEAIHSFAAQQRSNVARMSLALATCVGWNLTLWWLGRRTAKQPIR